MNFRYKIWDLKYIQCLCIFKKFCFFYKILYNKIGFSGSRSVHCLLGSKCCYRNDTFQLSHNGPRSLDLAWSQNEEDMHPSQILFWETRFVSECPLSKQFPWKQWQRWFSDFSSTTLMLWLPYFNFGADSALDIILLSVKSPFNI